MKLLFATFVLGALFIFSCTDDSDFSRLENEDTSLLTRDRDDICETNFQTGDVSDLVAGGQNWDYGQDWEGSFERQFNRCVLIDFEPGSCCEEVVVSEYNIEVPFKRTCNTELDTKEQNLLSKAILAQIELNKPECKGGAYLPVEINVFQAYTSCCVQQSPCPWEDDPCDCFEEYSTHPYFGCCQSYSFGLQIRYQAVCLEADLGGGSF